MFMGEYQHSIDTKGRISIPAKFRQDLGDSFVVTMGPERSLFVYPLTVWQELLKNSASKMSFTKRSNRAFVRQFFSRASEVELDKLGRIVVSGKLREYAHLTKEVVIIGVGERVEMWDKVAWEEYCQAMEDEYDDVVEDLVDFDLDV